MKKSTDENLKLYVLKDYNPDGSYSYQKTAWLSPDWVQETNERVAQNVSRRIYKCGFEWIPMPEKPSWFGVRHICVWRSICETMGTNPKEPHCTCGKVYNDPIHFKTYEIEFMTKEEKLFL